MGTQLLFPVPPPGSCHWPHLQGVPLSSPLSGRLGGETGLPIHRKEAPEGGGIAAEKGDRALGPCRKWQLWGCCASSEAAGTPGGFRRPRPCWQVPSPLARAHLDHVSVGFPCPDRAPGGVGVRPQWSRRGCSQQGVPRHPSPRYCSPAGQGAVQGHAASLGWSQVRTYTPCLLTLLRESEERQHVAICRAGDPEARPSGHPCQMLLYSCLGSDQGGANFRPIGFPNAHSGSSLGCGV